MTWAVTAVKLAAPYISTAASVVAIGSQLMSARGSVQTGTIQARGYNWQAAQALLKSKREALQYEQQANLTLERLLQNNAAAVARGFAGGVSGFSGSSKIIQERNEKLAGRDVQTLREGAKTALTFGAIEASMLQEAGEAAIEGSYFDAMSKIGSAAYTASQILPGGGSTSISSGSSSMNYNPATNLDKFYKPGIQL
jgi:hypothetical protein